jgi:hypothetical protein
MVVSSHRPAKRSIVMAGGWTARPRIGGVLLWKHPFIPTDDVAAGERNWRGTPRVWNLLPERGRPRRRRGPRSVGGHDCLQRNHHPRRGWPFTRDLEMRYAGATRGTQPQVGHRLHLDPNLGRVRVRGAGDRLLLAGHRRLARGHREGHRDGHHRVEDGVVAARSHRPPRR